MPDSRLVGVGSCHSGGRSVSARSPEIDRDSLAPPSHELRGRVAIRRHIGDPASVGNMPDGIVVLVVDINPSKDLTPRCLKVVGRPNNLVLCPKTR